MAGDWHCCTWGDAISLEYGKALRGHEGSTGRYRVFGSNGPIGWTDQALTQGPGVILGRKGAYRGVEFSRDPFHVIDTAYYVLPRMELDMRWLYYAVKHYRLGEIDDGSPIPSTTRAAVYVQELEIPPLPEQKRIAHILGTLDDKIELNRRMNATLEGISRAIFKSWFVDFDPVRQKAAGKQPVGMEAQTAALFPDSFEDSEIGEVPKGWRVMELGDVLELAYGKALKAEDRRTGGVPVFGSNGEVGLHDQSLVKGPGIVVGRKGNPGVITWASSDFFPIDTTFYVVPKEPCPSLYYLFYALQSHDLGSLGADSAVPGLNRNMAYMSKQCLPPKQLLTVYETLAMPVFTNTHANSQQSRTLAALRDTLLPKLLSGEVRVPEAEEAVEEVSG
jgi:type I restriction enzyme S subunit